MTAYQLRAKNTALESSNRIHADDVAQQYGFAGGLVPGVTDYAYMTNPVVTRWGIDWLLGGGLRARFLKPLYDGDETRIDLDDAGAIELRNGAGELCAAGSASLQANAEPPLEVGRAPLPEAIPAASADGFEARPLLGSITTELTAELAAEYLDRVGESLQLYREGRLVHPGHILSLANDVLVANVRLGPWIHVESEVRNHSSATWGETLETRARVSGLYGRKGHQFVELAVLVASGDRPVASIRHLAIYELRRPDSAAPMS